MRTILTTVGTSLLGNARRDLKLPGTQQPNEQELANYLRHTTADKASAETNSLSRLLHADDHVVFLHSQTPDGHACALALQRHYRADSLAAEIKEVPDPNYTETRFKMRGLRSLVATLCGLIRGERSQQREVLINATGGFKAEIAYATLIGLLFDVPVFYIHEAFRDIIEMPPTPIGWDYSLLAANDEFFDWITDDLRPTSEVDQRLKRIPQELEVRLLLSDEEGYSLLSPAGEAFFEAYRDRLSQSATVPIYLSAAARRSFEALADPNIRQLFSRAFEKLRLAELRKTGSDQVRNCDCRIFPKGHRDERVFFFESDDGVRVCEIGRHSDRSYERLIDGGVQRASYGDFQEWKT